MYVYVCICVYVCIYVHIYVNFDILMSIFFFFFNVFFLSLRGKVAELIYQLNTAASTFHIYSSYSTDKYVYDTNFSFIITYL